MLQTSQLFTAPSMIERHIRYKRIKSNHDSLPETWLKSSLEQVSLEGKLNGKWDQYGLTKLRTLDSFSGMQDTGRNIKGTLAFTPIQAAERLQPALASQLLWITALLSTGEANTLKTWTLLRPGPSLRLPVSNRI